MYKLFKIYNIKSTRIKKKFLQKTEKGRKKLNIFGTVNYILISFKKCFLLYFSNLDIKYNIPVADWLTCSFSLTDNVHLFFTLIIRKILIFVDSNVTEVVQNIKEKYMKRFVINDASRFLLLCSYKDLEKAILILIDFNSVSTCLGLSYAFSFGKREHYTFIFIFFA